MIIVKILNDKRGTEHTKDQKVTVAKENIYQTTKKNNRQTNLMWGTQIDVDL